MTKIKDKFTLLGDLTSFAKKPPTSKRSVSGGQFTESEEFYELSEENQELLNEQYKSMVKYLGTLEKRFELNKQLKNYLFFFIKDIDKQFYLQYNKLEFKIQEEKYGKKIPSSELE